MGVFACRVCGNPAAYFSLWPGGMSEHDAVCPGPPEKKLEWTECPYCGVADAAWEDKDLKNGFRATSGGGIEYHCYSAYCMD